MITYSPLKVIRFNSIFEFNLENKGQFFGRPTNPLTRHDFIMYEFFMLICFDDDVIVLWHHRHLLFP